jgi:hypothetical protein
MMDDDESHNNLTETPSGTAATPSAATFLERKVFKAPKTSEDVAGSLVCKISLQCPACTSPFTDNLGDFYKTDLVANAQPVYAHEAPKGAYLHRSRGGSWHVSSDYTTDSGWFYTTTSPFTSGPAQWYEHRAGGGWAEVTMGIAANAEACHSCTSAQPGSFLDEARACCVSCPVSQYQPLPASLSCLQCPSGQTTFHTGSTFCSKPATTSPKNWTELKAAIGENPSGNFTLPSDFDCSDYSSLIEIKGKVTVHGNGAVCDAGQQGFFFFLSSSGSSLTLDWMALRNGSWDVSTALLSHHPQLQIM